MYELHSTTEAHGRLRTDARDLGGAALPVGPRYIRAKESRFISSVLNVQAHGSRSGCFSAVKLASAASLVQQDAPAPVRRRGLGAAHG